MDIKYLHVLKIAGNQYHTDISQTLKGQTVLATISTLFRYMKNRTDFFKNELRGILGRKEQWVRESVL